MLNAKPKAKSGWTAMSIPLFIFMFLFVFSSTTILAAPVYNSNSQLSLLNYGTFQQAKVLQLKQSYNATNCNITSLLYPNSSTALSNQNMSKQDTDFSYNLPANFTNTLGNYIVNGECDQTPWAYTFTITTTGDSNSLRNFLIMGLISLSILILGYIFENYIFAFISGLAFFVTGVYSMIYGFGFEISNNTKMIAVIIIGLGMIISISSSFKFLEEMSEGEDNNNQDNSEGYEEE